MWLTPDERKRVASSDEGTLVLWRWHTEVKNCVVNDCYTALGQRYTILSVRLMDRAMVRRTQPQSVRLKLWDEWPDGRENVWRIELMRGDHSDKPRFLQPAGRGGGDYTSNPKRAMRAEPEPLTAAQLEKL